MATKAKQVTNNEIIIERIAVGEAKVWVRGQTPLIYNTMSAKVQGELLFPKGKKSAAEKATTMKHEPLTEYRASVYKRLGDNGATRCIFPAVAFKNAAVSAVRHIPNSGTTMTAMKQLLWVPEDTIDIYGVPKMFMAVVRSADMNKTPDIRTRAILPEWCACFSIRFVSPNINETSVARLLEASGLLSGVGDFRQEKGKGNYGQYTLCEKKDVEHIIKAGGMKAQDKALENPEYYNYETKELYDWFLAERKARGK